MNIPFVHTASGAPQGDPAGQAVASLKGYSYQLYASALAWISLIDEEELYLEVAQDYATTAKEALSAVQVKDTKTHVTVNSPSIRRAINDFVDLVNRNPGRKVALRFLTTSNIGTEKKVEHRAAGEPTLKYWDKAAGDADIGPLREVLKRIELSDAAKAYIKERTDEQLRSDLLRRISWDCGAPGFDQIKQQFEDRVVTFANECMGVLPSEAKRSASTILYHVLKKAVEPQSFKRKLTRAALLELLEKATHISIPRAGLETHVKAVVSEALASVQQQSIEIAPSPQLDIARDALERDFSSRYQQALQRSCFPELQKQDQFQPLARQILEGNLLILSEELRRRILLRAARSAALKKDLSAAERFMGAAVKLRGPETDLPAQARLSEARGDIKNAIQILRDALDPDSRSTLISIIGKAYGDVDALTWLNDQKLNIHDLTDIGVLTVCNFHLAKDDYARVKDILEGLRKTHIEDCPYFLLLRGAIRFASVLARPEQRQALTGMHVDIRRVRPITPEAATRTALSGAIQDMQRLIPILKELGLHETLRIAENYIYWFELLHPELSQAALARLSSDMQDPATALKRIQFALGYLPNFDPTLILKYLENRDAFGGMNDEELFAGFAIFMANHENTAPLADFIAQHRGKLDDEFGKLPIRMIEIEALARSGNASGARILLDANRDAIQPDELARLNAFISTAEGADPVTEFKRVYQITNTTEALYNLIGVLIQHNDHRSIGPYAEELFTKTGDLKDLALAVRSFANAGDNENFIRIVEANSALLDWDSWLRRHYAWQLFSRGRLTEALFQAKRLAETATTRDLDLEIAIAIESGEWETLSLPLTGYLQAAPTLPAIALIRAANLAQAAGQGPLKELVSAALAKGGDDPKVLLGAYMVYVEEGLEETKDEAHQWFQRALDLSGPDGPIRQFELKDILEKQTEWNEQSRRIQEGITRGDIPLTVAIHGLRTTLVDVLLRNFTRNSALSDARRKVAIPLFSGRRRPEAFGEVKRLALDTTAILVLGWLGLLSKVFDTFSEFVLPSGIFHDLFEGRRRIREFQKSRLRRAERIQQAIASGKIKIVRTSLSRSDRIVVEVGYELAGLLRVADSTNGIVLRPAPIHKPGFFPQGADVSHYSQRLADTHSLLRALQDNGLIDQGTEEAVKHYFTLQDKGWPDPAIPDTKRPLYLEGLGLIYLDAVGLLDVVLKAFPQVFIDSSTADEATELMEHHQHTNDVLQVIDGIREEVRKAQLKDKIIYGPQRSRKSNGVDDNDRGDNDLDSSTFNLITNLMRSDVAIIDDRGLNKELFVLDSRGHRARAVTSLDMIEELHRQQVISEVERLRLRYRLRVAGTSLVPLETEEIVVAALRNKGSDSAELRSMKESIHLARVTELPRFPSEIPWFATTMLAVKSAIIALWEREQDQKRAGVMADAILDLQAHPEDWVDQWDGHVPPDWVNAVSLTLVAGLALPVTLQDKEVTQAYNRWVESNVLELQLARSPETYAEVVKRVRSFINSVAEADYDEKEITVTKRVRVLFALGKLSDKLKSDVLKDPATAKLWDIPAKRFTSLATDLTVQLGSLFSVFRATAEGTTIPPLLDEKNKKHAVKTSIDQHGACLLEIGKHRLRFLHTALMAGSPAARLLELERIFGSATIHAGLQDELRRIVGRKDFWVDDYIAIAEALSSSPDEFQGRFFEKASTGEVTLRDVLPEDHRHWDNLTAPIVISGTLAEFISNELASERAVRMAKNPVLAFRSIALTFSAPTLVPHDLFRKLDKETKKLLLEEALLFEDHFSIAGAFELCADWISEYPDFSYAGECLLDRLFSDLKRLETACGMFGAALVLAVAKIAEDSKMNAKPAFWRRLAAASHAQLMVRSCGVTEIDHKHLMKWALAQSGQAYYLSVLCDFNTDPQWRPEWIDTHFLLSDVCGRAISACLNIPKEKVPASWIERIDKLSSWINEKQYTPLMHLPAVMEGTRRPVLPSISELPEILGNSCSVFMREPTVDHLLRITPVIHVYGPPREITESLHKAIGIIRADSSADPEGLLSDAINLLSHLAALLQDTRLANAVAEAYVERLVMDERREMVIKAIHGLLVCSAAESDKAAASLFFSRMLEQVCYIITKAELLTEVTAYIQELKLIGPELNCTLGRGFAIAKLGASRSASG